MGANSVTISGNCTRDPELSYTPKGMAACKFGVAYNEAPRAQGGEPKVVFVDVQCWGGTAEGVAEQVRKGMPIILCGRMDMDRWVDKAGGQNRSRSYVTATDVGLIVYKKKDQQPGQAPTQPTTQKPRQSPASSRGGSWEDSSGQ